MRWYIYYLYSSSFWGILYYISPRVIFLFAHLISVNLKKIIFFEVSNDKRIICQFCIWCFFVEQLLTQTWYSEPRRREYSIKWCTMPPLWMHVVVVDCRWERDIFYVPVFIFNMIYIYILLMYQYMPYRYNFNFWYVAHLSQSIICILLLSDGEVCLMSCHVLVFFVNFSPFHLFISISRIIVTI